MAISRVPGFSLLANLDRQGTDIGITSSGLYVTYWDVVNYRFGVNNSDPQQALDVTGNILTSNGHVYTGANISFDIGEDTNWWRTVYAESIQSVNVTGILLTNAQPNITSIGTLSNLEISGNLTAPYFYGNLVGNVTGIILTNAQPYINSLGTLSNLTVGGNITAPNFNGNVYGNITGTILTNIQPYIDTLGTLTNLNVTGNILANNIVSSTLSGTLLTNAQPNITSVGNLSVLNVTGNLSVDGNLIVNGISVDNLAANTITADIFGNITGYVLQGDQPFITNLANITVNTITILGGNLTIGGNVYFDYVNANVMFQGGNQVLDTATNIQISGDTVGYGNAANIHVELTTTGVSAGTYGADGVLVQFSVDDKGRISSAANISLSKIANLNFSNTTISSNTDLTISTVSGNIYLDAGSTGIVQIVGQDAIGIPAGDNLTRPLNPYIGYLRFNTDINDIEYWNGNIWFTPAGGVISSDTITPDGVSNVFVLSTNSSTLGVMVSINGTLQQPTTSYTIINNNQIQFTEIPLTTDIVEVRHIVAGSQTVSTGSLSFGPTTLVKLDVENVNITGNILPSADSTYSLGNSSLSWNTLYANDIVGTSPNIIVASSSVTTNVDVYSTSVYRTAKYILQANANSTFESLECLVTHDGSTAYRTVYGIISSGASLGNVTAIVTGGNVLVQYTSINNNTNIRISKQYLLI
jgi:hypothetical protein